MIKLTRLDGSELYMNPDLIESMEETPETRISLTDGNRFLVMEQIWTIVERIVSFRARTMRRAVTYPGKKYLLKRQAESFRPYCEL